MCTNIQDKIVESINHFSEIKKIKFTDKFIQNKFIQISEQEVEFRKFAEDYNHRLNTHAEDLFSFSKYCEEDNTNSDELSVSLRKLSEPKLNKSKSELLDRLENVKNCLDKIINEVTEYEKITEESSFTNRINELDKNKEEALSIAKGSVYMVGVTAIVTSIPLTAGASLGMIIPALSATLIANGAGVAVLSSVIAGASSIYGDILNYKLRNVKEQISQFLKETRICHDNINAIITHCKSHFEDQISEIEEVEKLVNIIKKYDKNGKQFIKPIVRTMSTRVRKNSVDIRQILESDNKIIDNDKQICT